LILSQCLVEITQLFESAQLEDAPLEARILLQSFLQLTDLQFLNQLSEPISERDASGVLAGAAQRLTGMPLAYVLGEWMFMGHSYQVGPGVLIPRPETELLVIRCIEAIQAKNPTRFTIIEVGVGSGIVSIELALKFPQATVFAWDKSAEALAYAKSNALKLGAEITFYEHDFFEEEAVWGPILASNDPVWVVSNPPYVTQSEWEVLDSTVRDFEPKMALVAEDNGVAFYRQMAQRFSVYRRRPEVLCEIGAGQGESVTGFFSDRGWTSVGVTNDLSGHERVIHALLV
jgi:release factor glutamine methyltransferase